MQRFVWVWGNKNTLSRRTQSPFGRPFRPRVPAEWLLVPAWVNLVIWPCFLELEAMVSDWLLGRFGSLISQHHSIRVARPLFNCAVCMSRSQMPASEQLAYCLKLLKSHHGSQSQLKEKQVLRARTEHWNVRTRYRRVTGTATFV
jgi:hypothetical protein